MDYATSITLDTSNNIYVTGLTYGVLDGNSSSGGIDVFLIKYNSSGVKQWSKQFGTSGQDDARGVSVDLFGNVFVTGNTSGAIGPEYFGDQDMFLVKFNQDGSKLWSKQLGTLYYDSGMDLSTDSLGNIFVGGVTNMDLTHIHP